ncbi:MAG: hypothetical protein IJ480_08035 [Clostridia bacterium]|nr:hypothetical protein [Clostridia bacterium]
MRTIYDGYVYLETEKPAFFAGANTGNGFAGEYHSIASEEEKERVWIIKGGSGTGKSTLMGKISADASESGHRCVHYLCSSDPESLDAVVIDNRFVVLDGTAPHVWEMQYPGAVSEILYVGKYWKREKLAARRAEIIRLCQEKQAAYKAGYGILAALTRLEEEQYAAAAELLDREKLEKFLNRLLRGVPRQERTGGTFTCRTWAVSMKGLARTNGLSRMADTHWNVEDSYQTAPCFFAMLAELCERYSVPVYLSRHPINDRYVEAYIPALSLHMGLGDESASDKTICMNRFVRKELPGDKKGTIRLAARCMTSLLQDACLRFSAAGEMHSALEAVYKDAMDFSQMNREMGTIRKQIQKIITET